MKIPVWKKHRSGKRKARNFYKPKYNTCGVRRQKKRRERKEWRMKKKVN